MEFGVKATGVQPSQVKPFISPGIENRAEAIQVDTLSGLVKAGTELYNEYQANQAGDELQKEIASYSETSPTIISRKLGEVEKERTILSAQGDTEGISAVEARTKGILDKYVNALSQGVMTPDEFDTRALKVAREAINKNPHLSQKILQQLQLVRELSGVGEVLKADQVLAKSKKEQQDEYNKDLRTRAKEQNIWYDSTTSNFELENKLKVAEGDDYNFQVFQRGKEKEEYYISGQAQQWAEKQGNSTVRGGITSFGKQVLALAEVAQADPTNYPKIKNQVKLEAEKMKASFVQGIPVRYRNQPEMKQLIEDFNRGIDTTTSVMENFGSGKDWKEAFTNNLEIVKLTQEKALRDTVNVENLNALTKLLAADTGQLVISEQARKALRDSGHSLSAAILEGNATAPVLDKNLPKSINDDVLSSVIHKSAASSEQDKDPTTFNKVLETYSRKSSSIVDPIQRDLFIYKNLEAISKAEITVADTNSIIHTSNMISQMINDPSLGAKAMYTNMKANGVKLERTSIGTVMFTGPNAQAFNDKYGIKLNTALSAYAKVNKKGTKEISDEFFTKFFGQLK